MSALRFVAVEPGVRSGDFALAAGEVHVRAFTLRSSANALDAWRRTLSDDERARAARFLRDADRDAYVAARGILRQLIGGYLGVAAQAVRFDYGPQGRPALAPDARYDGRDLRFSLAHAAGAAVLALTRACDVGVDLERDRPDFDPLAIARHHFHPNELDAIERRPDADARRRAFLRHWVAKEAVLKGDGAGLTLPLDRFEVRFGEDSRDPSIVASSPAPLAATWTVRMLPLPHGWHGAIATDDASARLVFPT